MGEGEDVVKFTEARVRRAWKALMKTFGPWDPASSGNMAAAINGVMLDVTVTRWVDESGQHMAKAEHDGIELERRPYTPMSLH